MHRRMNPARRLAATVTLASATLCAGITPPSHAAAPGVPALAATPADYVDYAVTSLPTWFRTGQMNALDNTPASNQITNAGAELGRVLFYDPRLSHNNGKSCASCHTQATGFGDTDQFSEGFEGGRTGRHSMGLSNARWYINRDGEGRFFWDERASSLEDQVLRPIQDAVEMGSNLTDLVAELNQTDFYPTLFQRAFGDSAVTSERMSLALSQFVRAMASYQSPYDQALAAGGGVTPNFAAVPSIANPATVASGHTLFQASCAGCHRTDAQVANDTNNIGLPSIDEDGDGDLDPDAGAGGGEFKSPSLRNIAMRGRFMHDGRFQTLAEVVEFYSSGIVAAPNLGRGLAAGGLNFTAAQKEALVAFLETLTDAEFLSSQLFSNPLVTLAGDYDGSGVVNEDDLAAWRAAYGLTAAGVSGPLAADGNGDGVVDGADYTVWRDNLGARWDDLMAALGQAVPEPAAAGLLGLVAAAGLVARRR